MSFCRRPETEPIPAQPIPAPILAYHQHATVTLWVGVLEAHDAAARVVGVAWWRGGRRVACTVRGGSRSGSGSPCGITISSSTTTTTTGTTTTLGRLVVDLHLELLVALVGEVLVAQPVPLGSVIMVKEGVGWGGGGKGR